jgi:hypothetical protein
MLKQFYGTGYLLVVRLKIFYLTYRFVYLYKSCIDVFFYLIHELKKYNKRPSEALKHSISLALQLQPSNLSETPPPSPPVESPFPKPVNECKSTMSAIRSEKLFKLNKHWIEYQDFAIHEMCIKLCNRMFLIFRNLAHSR